MILEQYTESSSGTGAVSKTYQGVRKITGVLTSMRYKNPESIEWDRNVKRVTHTFRMDFPIGITITEKDRFNKGTQIYKIESVTDPGLQNRYLFIELEMIK